MVKYKTHPLVGELILWSLEYQLKNPVNTMTLKILRQSSAYQDFRKYFSNVTDESTLELIKDFIEPKHLKYII